MIPGYGFHHEPILSVLSKSTYAIAHGKKTVVDDKQIPLHETDTFFDDNDPLLNATRHESDLTAFKPLTDIIIHACARPPQGKKALFLDVGVTIYKITKIVRVIGDRKVLVTASGFGFTDPELFDCMRIDYSRAYGGVDRKSKAGIDFVYPRNPVGKGFVISSDPGVLQDLGLPNLENPANLLKPQNLVVGKFENWMSCPEPVSLGYVSRNFHPRYLQAGFSRKDHAEAEVQRMMDIVDMEEVGAGPKSVPAHVHPLVNPEYFNGASPGLKLPYLRGDETFKLKHMDEAYPDFEFSLKLEKPRPWINIGQGKQYLEPVIQTVEIFKESNQCTVLWRGSARYGGPEWFKRYPKFAYGVDA